MIDSWCISECSKRRHTTCIAHFTPWHVALNQSRRQAQRVSCKLDVSVHWRKVSLLPCSWGFKYLSANLNSIQGYGVGNMQLELHTGRESQAVPSFIEHKRKQRRGDISFYVEKSLARSFSPSPSQTDDKSTGWINRRSTTRNAARFSSSLVC